MDIAAVCDPLRTVETPNQRIGVIFGKFYPIHTGHISMIYQAFCQVDELHVVVCSDSERDLNLYRTSKMPKIPTVQDRLRWVEQLFQLQPQIIIHHLIEDGITAYPNGWADWAARVKTLFHAQQFTPSVVFSSEPQDKAPYQQYLQLEVVLVDPQREMFNVSATKIRNNPYQYWQFIPQLVRPFFTQKIAIIGTPQTGKTTLATKLAAIFNTHAVMNSCTSQSRPLQYSDYPQAAMAHQREIDEALSTADKVLFLDTDLITMQAECIIQYGKEHPLINEMIDSYPIDFAILLKNRTQSDHPLYQQLKTLLQQYHIPYRELAAEHYLPCYTQAISSVNEILNGELTNRGEYPL